MKRGAGKAMIEIFADGCSLGNPGDAGIGVVIYRNKKIAKKISLYIGSVTNNVAEYVALICALIEALKLKEKTVSLYMDSELVVKQMLGKYKVKKKDLFVLHVVAKQLFDSVSGCAFYHRVRQENNVADSLAKQGARSRPKRGQSLSRRDDRQLDFQLDL